MVLRARIRPFARRAAFTAALGALLVPAAAGTATADAAKRKKKRYPVVTSVSPMAANVGDTLTIRGKNFKRGKNKNTVVFKRDGARAIFVKTTLGTARQIRVVVPDTLRQFMAENNPTRYRLRVFSQRFGKKFTPASKSPLITALPKPVAPGAPAPSGGPVGQTTPPPPPPPPPHICKDDEDHDLLDATDENDLGLDACKADTDGDGVPDGYEWQSARDLNDDEYQDDPNTYLPYPGKRPYPNGLDKDADVDHDGDSLTLMEEYRLWKRYGNTTTLANLIYSAGELYSLSNRDGLGRRRPTQLAATYPKHIDFMAWADDAGYNPVMLSVAEPWHLEANQELFELRDFDRSDSLDDHPVLPEIDFDLTTGTPPLVLGYRLGETYYFDLDRDGYVSDDERDEDADGLTNYDETHGRLTPEYWQGCYKDEKPYKVVYKGTDLTDPDTDGDDIRDGADDQDHDDIPNVAELSRNAASGYADWDRYKLDCNVRTALLEPDGSDPDADPDAPPVIHEDAYGRVNPFNPCLPFDWSRTCDRHPAINGGSAPFDGSPVWLALQ